MADSRHRTTFGNYFRFLMRVLGLTGGIAAVAGGVLLSTVLATPDLGSQAGWWKLHDELFAGMHGHRGEFSQVAACLVGGGAAAVLLWLAVELIGNVFLVTGRRTAVGLNGTLQMLLAAALLVVVNAYSFTHYRRFDTTRDGLFTLPAPVLEKLRALDPKTPTDIIVLQLHKTAGSLSDKADALDSAAEKKVVEKVKDLVDQLRELGPRFNVSVLDRQNESYEDQLDELTRAAPELREAIEGAPENSIFFRSGNRVQRMSFSEFYLLDKPSSLAEVTGKSGKARRRPTNLVMNPQGADAFARKVVGLEEKRPKVGLVVVHPLLSSKEDVDEYTSGGLRKSLELNGFEVIDVILKKWPPRASKPSPGVEVYEEYELNRVESEYGRAELLVMDRSLAISDNSEVRKQVEKADFKTLDKAFGRYIRRKVETEADRAAILKLIDESNAALKTELDEFAKNRVEAADKFEKAFANESAVDGRRSTDVKAKFARTVADCDVLVIPRMTVQDLGRGRTLPPALYNLSKDQADVVKDFIAAGKPVLALFGPTSFGGRDASSQVDPPSDSLAPLLGKFGIEFGTQAVIFDKEAAAMADEGSMEFGGKQIELPPLTFPEPGGTKKANPISAAFRATAKAVDAQLNVKRSGFCPVYLNADAAAKLPFAYEIAQTTRDSWNESQAVPANNALPKFDPAKPDDPKKGTRDEERRGPFTVGVAVEAPVPAEWLPAGAKPPTVRIVALGNGGLFVGKDLDPARETLLLHTLNWQLKRDDRLPEDKPDAEKWRYPRVNLTAQQKSLWWAGTFLGLPLVCGYLGLLVLMLRKFR